jgi:hypothetical protein
VSGHYTPEHPTYTACMSCAADWFAAFPAGVAKIACPKCGAVEGEPVKIRDWEWFKAFTTDGEPGSARWKRRAMVCLNAKQMETGT